MAYREEEWLDIAGIQHFLFCRRQWAIIHIEQQWQENLRTVEGQIVHEKCHDGSLHESRGDLLVARALRISSAKLGVSGISDVVEFHREKAGARLHGQEGLWRPVPVEYKRGKPACRRFALRKCCAAGFLSVIFFMMKSIDGRRWKSRKICEISFCIRSLKCTRNIPAGRHPRSR